MANPSGTPNSVMVTWPVARLRALRARRALTSRPGILKKMPFRYQQRPDGSWFCPPGEAYAAQFGLTYRLFSSGEIDWTYIQNLREKRPKNRIDIQN
ncbi:hypothetical protein [Dictyobacter vulcani]|uniref:hypothetical protein n=1 Tax=Dictyobacter vulcani TaxID=2607529 RepID=UPI0013874072|nr:hypothetical protein [Dictyobacter vulcani]